MIKDFGVWGEKNMYGKISYGIIRSTFLIDEKIDTGNIIIQKKIDIDPGDNFGDLHDKMSLFGSKLVASIPATAT